MLIARPSPVTLYSTVCIALALGGRLDSVLVGSDVVADGEGAVGLVDAGLDELGNGGTADCFPAVPLAITRAITSAATSSTAAAAATHNQRGAFGRPGASSSVDWSGGG